MRSKLNKAVSTRFIKAMGERWPQFEFGGKDRNYWWWIHKLSDDLYILICLQTWEREDKFRVELKWNFENALQFTKLDDFSRPYGGTSLGWLWNAVDNRENIWDLDPEYEQALNNISHARNNEIYRETGKFPPRPQPAEEALLLPRVPALVDDAISKLEQYGPPYFRSIADAHNVPWPAELPS